MTYDELFLFMVRQQRLTHKVDTGYQAGASGFHLHRRFEELGIQNLVTPSLHWDKRGKGIKNERLEAAALSEHRQQYGRAVGLRIILQPVLPRCAIDRLPVFHAGDPRARLASLKASRRTTKQPKSMETLMLKIPLATMATLCLCFHILIGKRTVDGVHRNIGAELFDLKQADDQGLLSEDQCRTQRAHILANPCKKGCDAKKRS